MRVSADAVGQVCQHAARPSCQQVCVSVPWEGVGRTSRDTAPSPNAGMVFVGSTLGGGSSEMRAVSADVAVMVGIWRDATSRCQARKKNAPFLHSIYSTSLLTSGQHTTQSAVPVHHSIPQTATNITCDSCFNLIRCSIAPADKLLVCSSSCIKPC